MSNLLEQASLVMIPSGYKEDVVYSEIPINGAGDLTFTRASDGTRINSQGLVEVVPWNLLQQSETFDSAPWTANNATITANSTTAPNGTTTGDTFTLTAGVDAGVYQAVNGVSNNYTISVYAKYVSGDKYLFLFGPLNSQGAKIWFDIQNGTVSNQLSGFTGTIENAGNGWYKCSIYNTSQAVLDYIQFGISTTNSNRVLSNNSVSYFWGAQVNSGTAKSYFPTTDRLNVPRLTYQNGGGGCPSLLLEKQSTNLVTYSQDFSNAAWNIIVNSGCSLTITPNYTTASNGLPATRLVASRTNTSTLAAIVNYAPNTSTNATKSIWMKNNNSGNVTIMFGDEAVTITDSWERYSVTNTYVYAIIGLRYSGVALSCDISMTGYQFELGSYPTSYIPTTSSSATRVADACYKTGISSLFGTNQGTFFIDFLYLNSVNPDYLFDVTDSTNSNRFLMFSANNTGLYLIYDSVSGGFSTYQLTNGQRYKIGVKYNSTATYWYINGALVATGNYGFAYQMSQIYLGQRYSFTDQAQIQVNETIVFPNALSGTELIALTTI